MADIPLDTTTDPVAGHWTGTDAHRVIASALDAAPMLHLSDRDTDLLAERIIGALYAAQLVLHQRGVCAALAEALDAVTHEYQEQYLIAESRVVWCGVPGCGRKIDDPVHRTFARVRAEHGQKDGVD